MDLYKDASMRQGEEECQPLDQGAEVNDKYGDALQDLDLQDAALDGDKSYIRLLIGKGADVNAQGGKYGNPLQAATIEGHQEIVQLLLDQGADVNAQGGKYGTALQAAITEGHQEIVQLLLDQGADINAQGGMYGTALQAAIIKGTTLYIAHQEIVHFLLDQGADINAQGGKYGTALQAAITEGHQEIVQLLLDQGADVNTQGGEFGTALQAAAAKGHQKILQLLLRKGAYINAEGGKYGTALQAATIERHREIVQLLLDQGADVNTQGGMFGSALQAAVSRSNGAFVQLLLNHGADVNIQGGEYGTTLQAAAARGDKPTVQVLLKNGADVNSQGGRFGTALQAAVFEGDLAIVQALLENGADVNTQGGRFGTALQAAAVRGHQKILRLLVEKGADLNTRGGEHETALQAAVYKGDIAIVQLLLENGADVNSLRGQGSTTLQAAVLSRPIAIVRLLLNQGADVNAEGGEFGTALQAAAFRTNKEIVQLLLEHGADINIQGGKYGNALQAAVFVYKGNMSIIQMLLDQGADVNAQGGEYGTALQAAAAKGHQEVVQVLLEKGADVNAQGGKYGTALQAAAAKGQQEVVQVLLEKGADVNAQGGEYGTAFQAAILDESMTIARLLLDRHGNIISIAEEVLKKVLETSENAFQLMSLLLQKQEGNIIITEEILKTAAKSDRGHQLVSLFLENSVKISDDVIWVRELGKVGYSTYEIMELLLEGSNGSPWIIFDPTCFPSSDIEPDRHIPGCCHSVSPQETLPAQIFDSVFEGQTIKFDDQGIMFQIQELCGMAGIKPTTQSVADWVGFIDFNVSDQALSVTYELPTDEMNPRDNEILWSRISRALDGFYHAAALLQAHNLCCNSFTVLRSGFQDHEPPGSSLVEIINISFKPILILIQELYKVMNPISEFSDFEKLLSTSTAILGLVWPEITKTPDDSSIEWCLHVCALAVQFLCLGFLSYCQAHIGSVQPFFLDFFAQQARLMGIQRRKSYPYLIAELVDLTCLGNMTRGKVLSFRSSISPPQNQLSKTQIKRLMQKHDILGHAEDLLDTWGPGNLILQGDRSGLPIAIKIGDGFIFANKDGKLHWSHQMPDIKRLNSIDIKKPLLIGSLVAVNAACKLIEAESRIVSASLLEELGTSRSSWQKSQRQLAIQGGQYVVCQAAETWNKQIGIPVKDRALAYPPEVLVQYLDSYWGVQVSYCTGVARRVRLRKLVADLVQHFSTGSAFNHVLEDKMKDETLRPKDLYFWLNSLSPDLRERNINVICDILNTLRHTGIDSTETYFCVAWPFEGNITQCFKIPLEHDSSWARFLADSHDSATFAYITMECFETPEFRCSKITEPCFKICLLETAVSRSRKEKLQDEYLLQHEEICFFSKQDTLFWVKVLKKHADQPASLIDFTHFRSLPYRIRQILYLSERRKQRSRLRECATMWTRGEAVSVFSG